MQSPIWPKQTKGDTLLPHIKDLQNVSTAVAIAVAKAAIKDGVSRVHEQDVEKLIEKAMWKPEYKTIRPISKAEG